MKVKKAIIPAAGLGTRVLPASKAVPKEMLNIVDKPAIQYLVEEAVAAGIEDILIITNRGKGVIEDHFDHSFELEANLPARRTKRRSTKRSRQSQTLQTYISSARRRQRASAMLSSAARASSATSRSPFSTATMSPSATTR